VPDPENTRRKVWIVTIREVGDPIGETLILLESDVVALREGLIEITKKRDANAMRRLKPVEQRRGT